MSGVIDDVGSIFSDVGDAVSSWFGSGDASDVADVVANGSEDAASAANDASLGLDATEAASDTATSGTAISNAASYLDNTAAASYTAGVSTADFGQGFNFADDANGIAQSAENAPFNAFDPSAPMYTNMALSTAANGPAAAQQGASLWDKAGSFLGLSGSGTTGTTGAGVDSTLSKLMMAQMVSGLVTGGIQALGSYEASKPKPPANFSGRTPGGGGGGLGMTSTNGGFGLAAGGSTPAPSGVPSALQPNAQAEALGGSGGGVNISQPPTGQAGGGPNIQQTVANQAGFGGLIPQGAVNYMKGGQNG